MKAQEPVISTWLYKMVASMEAAIFNCHCDQMQNCEGGCETICLRVASVPSAVQSFWVSERGSQHLKLSWTPPAEYNGNLLGYTISFKLGN